jgi:hypothetical protein
MKHTSVTIWTQDYSLLGWHLHGLVKSNMILYSQNEACVQAVLGFLMTWSKTWKSALINECCVYILNLSSKYAPSKSFFHFSFPELVVPLTFQLKQFIKACRASNYVKKMKQVLDKTIESGKFIIDKRKKVTFGVRDLDEVSDNRNFPWIMLLW